MSFKSNDISACAGQFRCQSCLADLPQDSPCSEHGTGHSGQDRCRMACHHMKTHPPSLAAIMNPACRPRSFAYAELGSRRCMQAYSNRFPAATAELMLCTIKQYSEMSLVQPGTKQVLTWSQSCACHVICQTSCKLGGGSCTWLSHGKSAFISLAGMQSNGVVSAASSRLDLLAAISCVTSEV